MRQQLLFLIYVFSIICITSCLENSGNKNLDSWLGNYEFSEKPVKALGGYHMVMNWDLSVNKINDSYTAILNVNGQQTSFAVFNFLAGNDTTLFIIYDSTLDGIDQAFKKGDTLFSLSRITARRISTRWGTLQPILSESAPQECSCFVFTGINKDNNTLKLPQ